MATVYKLPNPNNPKVMDYYDAATNQKISNPQVLQTQYAGATEVAAPGSGVDQGIANSSPNIIRPGASGMSDWKSYQGLKDTVAEIIKMRQGANKDIVDPTTYWKGKMRTSSDFGDPALYKLSPADQASLRLSNQGLASAAQDSLSTERNYREKVSGDTMTKLDSMYGNAVNENKNAADNAYRDKTLAADTDLKKQDANQKAWDSGRPLPYPEVIGKTPTTPGNTNGQSLSVRNNNPSNLKFSSWQTQYGAVKDPDSDFAKFPDIQSAQNAYKGLLSSPTGIYKGLDNNAAMKKWSSDYVGDPKGYNYDELVRLGAPAVSKKFANFTPREWDQFFAAQQKREGWIGADKTTTTNSAPTEKKNSFSKKELDDLSFNSKVDVNELYGKTDNEIRALKVKLSSVDTVKPTPDFLADSLEGRKIAQLNGLSREEMITLIDILGGGLTEDEKTTLFKSGITQETITSAQLLLTGGMY